MTTATFSVLPFLFLQNSAAKVISLSRHSDHVTPLSALHRLPHGPPWPCRPPLPVSKTQGCAQDGVALPAKVAPTQLSMHRRDRDSFPSRRRRRTFRPCLPRLQALQHWKEGHMLGHHRAPGWVITMQHRAGVLAQGRHIWSQLQNGSLRGAAS